MAIPLPPMVADMPQSIGSALGGLQSGIGTAYNYATSEASKLYNALPSMESISNAGNMPPSAPAVSTALASNPATAGISPSQVTSVGPAGGAAPATGVTDPAASPLAMLGAIAQALEMYKRFELQSNLQNPSWVAGQVGRLYTPLSGALRNEVTAQTQAGAQESGLGGAPGLFRQSLAQALAPYQFEQQQNAINEYLSSIAEAEQAYPLGGGYGDLTGAAGAQTY